MPSPRPTLNTMLTLLIHACSTHSTHVWFDDLRAPGVLMLFTVGNAQVHAGWSQQARSARHADRAHSQHPRSPVGPPSGPDKPDEAAGNGLARGAGAGGAGPAHPGVLGRQVPAATNPTSPPSRLPSQPPLYGLLLSSTAWALCFWRSDRRFCFDTRLLSTSCVTTIPVYGSCSSIVLHCCDAWFCRVAVAIRLECHLLRLF